MPNAAPTLRLEGVAKSFGPVAALRSGTLVVQPGSIHALVGENGAGKSTLVKIVGGVHRRDSGTVELDGEPVDFAGPAEAKAAGVAVIHQEPASFPDLTVTENIFLGREPLGRFRRIDRRAMREGARDLFRDLGVDLDPDRPAEGLSIADQQIVEIAKAISLDARLLVMDEPTAALSAVEVRRLFAVARGLRDAGRAVVFISHRLDEVADLCDTVTVMRDGEHVSTDAVADVTPDELVRRMVGRDVAELYPKVPSTAGEVVLRVEGLESTGTFHDVSFEVRAGEIVGLAGLVGAGRSEIARAVFGVDRYDAGRVTVGGRPLRPGDPAAAIAAGLALVPEDRRLQGLVTESSVGRNVSSVMRRRLARLGILLPDAEARLARDWSGRLEVKAGALDALATTMSGGNQQKVVLAKWLATGPKVLIVDEPTRGIDVGTKAEVHRLLSTLAAEGLAVLMISSELPEVLGMADRVLVVREGRIAAELGRAEATPEAVMRAATPGASQSGSETSGFETSGSETEGAA
ncbi:sugar ABC transporter ATP-binding protein [Promicromonospora sp. NFX87]|uniref:sugar ABC transporter ATP-binding protein n=1 Tax=Promicromonospora sp. NFX87 TaxID=3402691 RepID=UPI003AFA7656